jgi:gamma-glutamyltranspeptidase
MISFSNRCRRAPIAIVLVVASAAPAGAQERRLYSPPDLAPVRAVSAEHGMVVAPEKIAAQFGADILRQGGNAVDAAVATGFVLAVTYPRAGNIGGGFMVIHSTERNEDVAIDYRETAPAAATRDMYLGADGKPDTVAAAVAAPRVHHQWMPDEVRVERGFSEETLEALKAMGHQVIEPLGQTSANSIAVTPNGLLGAPDPRTRGPRQRGSRFQGYIAHCQRSASA